MSETLATHHRIVERLSRHNNLRFDKFSWPCEGHECPSYCSFFWRNDLRWMFKARFDRGRHMIHHPRDTILRHAWLLEYFLQHQTFLNRQTHNSFGIRAH